VRRSGPAARRAITFAGSRPPTGSRPNLPSIGSEVGPYLPFANVFRFLDVQWLFPAYTMPWGEIGSLVYFIAEVAVVYAAAIVVVNRRDA
jgi:ABC-2 type transport system permease protein